MMITFPNAKINLGLNVVSRRPDGYSNLETVFYPIPVCDALELLDSDEKGLKFVQTGLEVDGDVEKNLVVRAFRAVEKAAGRTFDAEVHLQKSIPFGAGIGGGSADASFMIRMMNEHYHLGWSDEKMAEIAITIGADCPIFIYNRPMYAEGKGEILSDIDVNLSGYYFVLVKPNVHVSTADAFRGITPAPAKINCRDIVSLPMTEWKGKLENDFEKTIFALHPSVAAIKEKLYELGAVYASMSGSGSSLFGFFEEKPNLEGLFGDAYVFCEKL